MKQKNGFEARSPDTVVITTVETLKSAFRQWADERERERCSAEKDTCTWLDERTVQRRLGKSHATLWRWNKSGYLTCHKVGGKNCYRLADIERIEKGL